MTEVGMHEAKTKLSQLVARAEQGEEIVITRNGVPTARLMPVTKRNQLAAVRGIFRESPSLMTDDFDELPPDIAAAFGMQP